MATLDAAGGPDLQRRVAANPLVGGLLALHDLHPVELATRLRYALDTARRRLGSHGVGIELTGVDGDGMCLGIPGEIVEILADREDLAMVSVEGVKRVVNIGLLEDEPLVPGDWILIHVGFALSKIDEREAKASLEWLTGVGDAYTDELAALAESDIT